MSKKHKQQVKHTKVPANVKSSEERSGKSTLWALLVVIAGLTGSGILVQQTLAQEQEQSPEGNVIQLSVSDLASSEDDASPRKIGVFRNDVVDVPVAGEGKTVQMAVEEIVASAQKKSCEFLSTNVLAKLQMPYVRKGEESREKYGALLGRVLPTGLEYWTHPDEDYVVIGTAADVNRIRTGYDIERLANNHERIAVSFEDTPIFDAILRVKALSKANILTAYLEKDDQRSEKQQKSSDDGSEINIADVAPGGTNSVSNCRRVTYSTDGVEMEWRTVLSSILEPDYTFDEVDGKVRIATREKFEAMRRKEQDAKPMEVRYVRVFHANPEEIVERLKQMAVTMNSKAVVEVAPYQEKGKGHVNSFRHNLSSSSTSLSTGGTTIGDSSSSSSGSWGNLLRPKNPPAILVYDTAENLDKVENLIHTMDVREKQVLIEALILDLSDTGSKNLGMKLDEMGFGNVPLLGVSWSKDHARDHASKNTDSRAGLFESGKNNYVGRGRGTDGVKVSSDGTVVGDAVSGIAPSWAYGNVSESFVSGQSGMQSSYEKSSSSTRNRAWSTVFGPLDFNFVLEMVEEKGNGKLLSSPVLTIGDHSEAMLHVGNVTPILQLETEVTSSTTSIVTEDVEWQELVTGILMWVGPEVTEDGKSVRLWVHPKISETTGEWETYKETRYPHLTSQEMDTRVTVPSGNTLMMGGLTRTEESEELKKVPVLGDIPFLGRLFRHTSKSSNRRNLVILIRPTILDDENPETGFETPANVIIEPMMSESGRNLKDVSLGPDKMREREAKIKTAVRNAVVKPDEEPSIDEAETGAVDGDVEAVDESVSE